MSFFGFDDNNLENDRQRFLRGEQPNNQPIPEYTWGAEGYDGLGDTLQEGGDDLNDETFGSSGPIGEHRAPLLGSECLLMDGRQGF